MSSKLTKSKSTLAATVVAAGMTVPAIQVATASASPDWWDKTKDALTNKSVGQMPNWGWGAVVGGASLLAAAYELNYRHGTPWKTAPSSLSTSRFTYRGRLAEAYGEFAMKHGTELDAFGQNLEAATADATNEAKNLVAKAFNIATRKSAVEAGQYEDWASEMHDRLTPLMRVNYLTGSDKADASRRTERERLDGFYKQLSAFVAARKAELASTRSQTSGDHRDNHHDDHFDE